MRTESEDVSELLEKARQGDARVLGELLDGYRVGLRRMVKLRMDYGETCDRTIPDATRHRFDRRLDVLVKASCISRLDF